MFIIAGTVLFSASITAQVANDDCLRAQIINAHHNAGFLPGGACWEGSPADTSINSANTNSLPNFPYPSNPNPCQGYTATMSAPANDVWYKIENIIERVTFFISSFSDTTHMSFWIGADCATLTPLNCYTLAPNDYIYDTIITTAGSSICFGTNNNKLFIQISGNRIGSFPNYGLCLSNEDPPLTTCYAVYSTPTPVLCFNYNLTHTNVCHANDGSATVSINGGDPPYTYQWNDGNTDSIRTNLNVGKYIVTITDNNGCSEKDSVNIDGIDTSITRVGNILTANATGVSYQWLDCGNGNSPIAGAINQSYAPSINGNYAVVITKNSCSDSSACIVVNPVGIDNNIKNNQITVYPNPTTGELHVLFQQQIIGGSVKITDVKGQTILEKNNLTGKQFTFNMESYATGIYFIEFNQNGVFTKMEFLKQ